MHRSGRVNPCRYLCSPFNDCQYSAVIAVEIKGETGMELVLLLFFLPLHKFKPMTSQCSISVPPKISENKCFLTFSGGTEMKHLFDMG